MGQSENTVANKYSGGCGAAILGLTLSLQSDSGGAGIQTKKEENLYIVSAGLFLLLL